jgi:hypothetical protein
LICPLLEVEDEIAARGVLLASDEAILWKVCNGIFGGVLRSKGINLRRSQISVMVAMVVMAALTVVVISTPRIDKPEGALQMKCAEKDCRSEAAKDSSYCSAHRPRVVDGPVLEHKDLRKKTPPRDRR